MSESGQDTSKARWQREILEPALRKAPERRRTFATSSGLPVERLYDAGDVADRVYTRDVGDPGTPPYVRGVGPDADEGRRLSTRQAPGTGDAAAVNARYRERLEAGDGDICLGVDAPTREGRDADDARARGRVGREGLSISSVEDLDRVLDGIPLDRVRLVIPVHAAGAPLAAMLFALAERRGVSWTDLAGNLGNDVLGASAAGTPGLLPPGPALALAVEVLAFCRRHAPRLRGITIDAAAVGEAGGTPVQELGLALTAGRAYIEAATASGVTPDAAAAGLAVTLDVREDFFEEVARLRAARALWAEMTGACGVEQVEARQVHLHVRTTAVGLTREQPYNNVIRTAIQTLAAALGGAASIGTPPFDAALGTPSRHGEALAEQTQRIVGHESGVAASVDALGGSYFVEALTRDMETAVREAVAVLDAAGGLRSALADGTLARLITEAREARASALASEDRIVVGVNTLAGDDILERQVAADDAATVEASACAGLAALRAVRREAAVTRALAAVGQAAGHGEPVLPALVDAARASATLGEMCEALRQGAGVSTGVI